MVNERLAKQCPELADIFVTEAGRVRRVDDDRRAFLVAQASLALVTLAAPVLGAYAARKDDSGLLDFDDLIGRTSALLVDPARPGCSTSWTAGSTICCSTRCRTPRPRNGTSPAP